MLSSRHVDAGRRLLRDRHAPRGWLKDFGDAFGQQDIEIIDSEHPMADGKAGTVRVSSAPAKFVWGKPATTAARIARLPGRPETATIFGYEAGSAMVNLNAPARRVGCFLGRDAAATLTPEGWRLHDAAVRWATATRATALRPARPRPARRASR